MLLPPPQRNDLWYHYGEGDTAIVFVHGIFSDSRSCWLNTSRWAYWPELVKADDRFGDCGIYLGGYPTSLDASDFNLSDCATTLIRDLQRPRRGLGPVLPAPTAGQPETRFRRVLFVCHSTGGIVVRKMLVDHFADFAHLDALAVALIASPSRGSVWAVLARPISISYGAALARALEGGEALDDLDNQFRRLVQRQRTGSPPIFGAEAFENRFIFHWRWMPTSLRVVKRRSASVGYWDPPTHLARTDHFGSVKPSDHDHPSHLFLVDTWLSFLAATGGQSALGSWTPHAKHSRELVPSEFPVEPPAPPKRRPRYRTPLLFMAIGAILLLLRLCGPFVSHRPRSSATVIFQAPLNAPAPGLQLAAGSYGAEKTFLFGVDGLRMAGANSTSLAHMPCAVRPPFTSSVRVRLDRLDLLQPLLILEGPGYGAGLGAATVLRIVDGNQLRLEAGGVLFGPPHGVQTLLRQKWYTITAVVGTDSIAASLDNAEVARWAPRPSPRNEGLVFTGVGAHRGATYDSSSVTFQDYQISTPRGAGLEECGDPAAVRRLDPPKERDLPACRGPALNFKFDARFNPSSIATGSSSPSAQFSGRQLDMLRPTDSGLSWPVGNESPSLWISSEGGSSPAVEFDFQLGDIPSQDSVDLRLYISSGGPFDAVQDNFDGWILAFPGSNGTVELRRSTYLAALQGFQKVYGASRVAASSDLYAPVNGRPYRVRIRLSNRLQVFSNGGQLFDVPNDLGEGSLRVGISKIFGGLFLREVALHPDC